MSSARVWLCSCSVFAALALATPPAGADGIDANIKELASGNYKTRLAAALALAKSSDNRAVMALITVLQNDKDSALRRVAAIALGRGVDGLPEATIEKVRAALTAAAASDTTGSPQRTVTAPLARTRTGCCVNGTTKLMAQSNPTSTGLVSTKYAAVGRIGSGVRQRWRPGPKRLPTAHDGHITTWSSLLH